MNLKNLIHEINMAFSNFEFPGNWCLKGSFEGDEPYLLDEEFSNKADWSKLDHKFLDSAPGNYSSALSFFSDEAFRFYLPAYLIADARRLLKRVNVVFYLTNGLTAQSALELVNERRYDARTSYDYASYRMSVFNYEMALEIHNYLVFKSSEDDYLKFVTKQAIDTFWLKRISSLKNQ